MLRLLLVVFLAATANAGETVIVYGGTPAGIAAAVAAADDGESVLLVEPTARLGGLVTCGLSHTDFHARQGLTGAYRDFAKRVEAYYIAQYGKDSQQVKDCWGGVFAEPKVNLAVFEGMLAERKSIRVLKETRLGKVDLRMTGAESRIASVTLIDQRDRETVMTAKVFIDASYEGDLMAAAGVPFRVGREAKREYGESLAPESADGELQAYNFRWIMTKDPANRVSVQAPKNYRREDFVGVLEILKSGKIKTVFGYPKDCLFKAQTPPLPNGKYDINDVSRGLVRLSLPGKNLKWPAGDLDTRRKIFDEHEYDQVGLLYFLQNDPEVPEKFRSEAREWGWCRDEFNESGHRPPQLYVREARRMIGKTIFTQADSEPAKGDARAKLHADSIAIGEYGNNCHGTGHEGPRFGGKHTGEFYNPVPPYQIPYGVMVPERIGNLLVPVAASSSHVGFCALRLEPIWMSLGQAAGHAAHLAADRSVQAVPVPKLQARLHRAGAATVYVQDVPADHADFAIVQRFGTAGAFHGLFAPPEGSPRGKTLHGQYCDGYPRHDANLDAVLTADLAERWRAIATGLGIDVEKLPLADGKTTRRDFVRAAK